MAIPRDEIRKQGHPRFYEILDEMAEVHCRKNAGYAGKNASDPLANFRMSENFGIPAWKGALVRMTDKVIRIFNLTKNEESDMVGESLIDTLLDLANYAILIVIMLEEKQGHKITPS